jgi:hypothetical protein
MRNSWENNIKIYFREIDVDGMDWIYLSQYRDRWWTLTNLVMNVLVP